MNDILFHKEWVAHEARNRILLANLAGRGIDVTSERRVDIHFWATSEAVASELATALKDDNFESISVAAFAGAPSLWTVEAYWRATPQEMAGRIRTLSLVRLAAIHGATYDGWGTEV
jgi:hypothetical protein